MSSPKKIRRLTEKEYLDAERVSDVHHEYVDGHLYAMAGASERHNRIAGNLYFHLRSAARGGTCGVFMSDMKLRIATGNAFYYPDLMLVCDPEDTAAYFKEAPCLVAEVLSESTATVDRREKLLAYQSIDSLRYYLLLSAERPCVEYFVRKSTRERESAQLDDGEILEVECDAYRARFRLEDLYEDIRFP